jgi:hypothetical protein
MALIESCTSRNFMAIGFGYCLHEITNNLKKINYIKTAKSIEYLMYSSIIFSTISFMKQDYDMGKYSLNNFSLKTDVSMEKTLFFVFVSSIFSFSISNFLVLKKFMPNLKSINEKSSYLESINEKSLKLIRLLKENIALRGEITSLNDQLMAFKAPGG